MPTLALLLAALSAHSTANMSETARIGGSGGNRTVSMDCGPAAFIVGVTATGGRDGALGFNLVRRLRFTCRTFTGTTPGSASQTTEAVSDKQATLNTSSGGASCPTGQAFGNVELY